MLGAEAPQPLPLCGPCIWIGFNIFVVNNTLFVDKPGGLLLTLNKITSFSSYMYI